MPEDINVVEALRSKAEWLDMDQYLKTKMGGYTKQSVLEYLNVLRKQQQNTAETFYQNLQTLHNEKEELIKANETLQYQIKKTKSEYQNLKASMMTKLDGADYTLEDIISLKNTIAAQEEEIYKIKDEEDLLENKIDMLNLALIDQEEKLKLAEREIAAAKEVIISEKNESKEQRRQVAELSIALEAKIDEIKYLKALQSEGQIAELTSKVNSLSNSLLTQTEIMENQNSDIALKENIIETLTAENQLQKQRISDLSNTLENLQKQDDKLMFANKALADKLQEDYKKNINLIMEKSDITIEKIVSMHRLDEANSKIAMLELEIKKQTKADEMKSLENKGALDVAGEDLDNRLKANSSLLG